MTSSRISIQRIRDVCRLEEKEVAQGKEGGNKRRKSKSSCKLGLFEKPNTPHGLPMWLWLEKPSGKWRIRTDYTDLNKACPKDSYPFPNMDQLVDGTVEHKLLSFFDMYLGYNQIRNHPRDKKKKKQRS